MYIVIGSAGNTIQSSIKIVLPLSKNGIAALAVLSFIDHWNMIEQPLIFLKSGHIQMLSIFLARVNSMDLGVAFASSTIYMIPAVIVFAYAGDYLVDALKHSCIKQ